MCGGSLLNLYNYGRGFELASSRREMEGEVSPEGDDEMDITLVNDLRSRGCLTTGAY